jgi:hypothetical protein
VSSSSVSDGVNVDRLASPDDAGVVVMSLSSLPCKATGWLSVLNVVSEGSRRNG